MFENLAIRLKAFRAFCEYMGNPNISPTEIIRRPLKGIDSLLPTQRRTRLLTSLAIVGSLHKRGYLTAATVPPECERIVTSAPETERYELVKMALHLDLQTYEHPRKPYKRPLWPTSELYKWVHKENYDFPRMPTHELLECHRKLIKLVPPSERLVLVNTALGFAKKVREDGNIDGKRLRLHLWNLADLLPKNQRQEVVDFGIQCDIASEREQPAAPEMVLRNRVFYIWQLSEDQRVKAAQRYDLWGSATAAWTEFATKGNSDALPALRDTFALCGAPPAETGITGVTISKEIGRRGMVCAIFEREKGPPAAVIGTNIVSYDNMRILADPAPTPPWLGHYDPAERDFIRQNLPKLSAPAAA